MSTPMSWQLEHVIYGFPATAVLHLADKYGLTGFLIEHGPSTANLIAADKDLDADTTERMLLVLAALGVVRGSGSSRFALADLAVPYLARGSALYIGGFLRHLARGSSAQLDRLEQYLLRGKPAVDAESGTAFDRMYRTAGAVRAFMDAMWDLNFGISPELVKLAGLAGATRLVDVGGGGGPFPVAALQAHPELSAVIFDLPQVQEFAQEKIHGHGLAGRLEFIAGDAFTGEFPEGDCLCFANVLSDWPDGGCLGLLRKACKACAPGGRVLIIERLFNDERTGPLATAAMNLLMHLEMCGRHRSAPEYVSLLKAAGFTGCEVRRSDGDRHLVIGCRP